MKCNFTTFSNIFCSVFLKVIDCFPETGIGIFLKQELKIEKSFIEILFQLERTIAQMVSATSGCPYAQAINDLQTFARKVVTPVGINCRRMLS